jgi:hypothetical protein
MREVELARMTWDEVRKAIELAERVGAVVAPGEPDRNHARRSHA